MEPAVATRDPRARRNVLDVSFQAKADYVYGGRSHKALMDALAGMARTSGAAGLEAELYEDVLRGVADVEPEDGKVSFPFEIDKDVPLDAIGRLSGLEGLGEIRADLSKHNAHCAVERDPARIDYWNHVMIRAKDGKLAYQAIGHGEAGSAKVSDVVVLDEPCGTIDGIGLKAAEICAQYPIQPEAAGPERAAEADGPEMGGE